MKSTRLIVKGKTPHSLYRNISLYIRQTKKNCGTGQRVSLKAKTRTLSNKTFGLYFRLFLRHGQVRERGRGRGGQLRRRAKVQAQGHREASHYATNIHILLGKPSFLFVFPQAGGHQEVPRDGRGPHCEEDRHEGDQDAQGEKHSYFQGNSWGHT